MKAKIVNEDINFEKEQDPKRALNIGVGDKLRIEGIDAFTHWLYNVDYKFIEKVWGGTWLENHLKDKWEGILKRSKENYADPNSLMKFVRDLDNQNQNLLYEYILKNHSNKW